MDPSECSITSIVRNPSVANPLNPVASHHTNRDRRHTLCKNGAVKISNVNVRNDATATASNGSNKSSGLRNSTQRSTHVDHPRSSSPNAGKPCAARKTTNAPTNNNHEINIRKRFIPANPPPIHLRPQALTPAFGFATPFPSHKLHP